MATEKPRFTVSVNEEMLERIDDFRFEKRFPSRADAVSELLDRALSQAGYKVEYLTPKKLKPGPKRKLHPPEGTDEEVAEEIAAIEAQLRRREEAEAK